MRYLVVFVGIFALACGDGGDGEKGSNFGETKFGDIQVEHESPVFKKGETAIGETALSIVTITNVVPQEENILHVTARLEYTAPLSVVESDGPSLELVGGESSFEVAPLAHTGDQTQLQVRFRRYDDAIPRRATLHIESDTQDAGRRHITVEFKTEEGLVVASVSPPQVDFGSVKAGESPHQNVVIANTGSADLRVSQALFQGHPDYRLIHQGAEFEPGEAVAFDPVLTIPSGESETFVVRFTPLTAVPASAKLVFYTNDPAHPSGIAVEIVANKTGPAISITPKKVDFGGKLVGQVAVLPVTISNVGTQPLEIAELFLSEDTHQDFSLQGAEVPATVPVNASIEAQVRYAPAVLSELVDGQVVPSTGILVVESDAFNDTVEVGLSGVAVKDICPNAIGIIQEGEQVIPQTTLHIFGDQSFAPSGDIAAWKWSVQQPTGSSSGFLPSDTFPNPTFAPNVAGEYQFSLDVWDSTGVKSCVPWKSTVLVIPDEAIHVELLWHTPNDPDETDQGPEAGTDLDLHFAHDKFAATNPDIDMDGKPDVWFDQPFDTFWFNAHPNWGSFDPSIDDDPGLDLDDTDGAGPENLNLNIPENTDYRVGVHYWSDHEYGPSYATVRIYIYSNLVFEVADVKLSHHDMWCVATIAWPSGKITLCQEPDGGYKITPDYQNPFFQDVGN